MARPPDNEDNDSHGFAVERARAAGKIATDVRVALMEHVLRCEARAIGMARDIGDMRRDLLRSQQETCDEFNELKGLIRKIVRYGVPALAVLFIIQLLGLENAVGIFKAMRGLQN